MSTQPHENPITKFAQVTEVESVVRNFTEVNTFKKNYVFKSSAERNTPYGNYLYTYIYILLIFTCVW